MLRGLVRVQACYRTLLDVPRRTMPRWVRGEFTLEVASGRPWVPSWVATDYLQHMAFPAERRAPSRSGVVFRRINPLHAAAISPFRNGPMITQSLMQGLVLPYSEQAVLCPGWETSISSPHITVGPVHPLPQGDGVCHLILTLNLLTFS